MHAVLREKLGDREYGFFIVEVGKGYSPNTNEGRMVLSRGRLALRLFNWCAFVLLGALGAHDVIFNSRPDVLANAVCFGFLCACFLASCTTRIEVKAHQLFVVNVLTITDFTANDIASANGENGLTIDRRDGTSCGFWGYGSSLVGAFTSNGRARELATRILLWKDQNQDSTFHHHRDAPNKKRPRFSVIGIVVGCMAAFLALGLLAH